ncbi:MAG: VTC domain-containing protein [Dehalococcoidales bacterium]|nr:VTC domain-containing protein [Dehalococcoidales bacterium]
MDVGHVRTAATAALGRRLAIKIAGFFRKSAITDISPPERFERKFYIVPENIGFAHSLLRQFCRPDREYPVDTVNSLYFDSDDLAQYERSASGEYRKDKVRIRWYGEVAHLSGEVPVFIEVKSRRGFASSKRRERLLVPASHLRGDDLARGIVSRSVLMETLARLGHFPEEPLKPVILISYRRHRFSEMLTGMRVSLDEDIRGSVVAPELARRPSLSYEITLSGGVIEVKGQKIELPPTLRQMRILDVDWGRFSKYGACLDAYFTTPGTVARLSPPGRIVQG